MATDGMLWPIKNTVCGEQDGEAYGRGETVT